ncbi:phage tail sheath C-terminal domain-containing protein, partial [Herbaspirillum sp. YR522]|uniref:phage tail sheath C-terminal domain-containing protein n=1 Tax=Herbaspirillum sp. YR522 TaxID=1144342 RepID=UPI00026F53F4
GARTCEVTDRQWRYINVRRLFNQVERDISDVMQRYMYEPNTPATWVRAKTSISNYLYNLWQLGALQGARPEDGYQVSLGLDESMSATDIEEGKMIACLRLAPSKPAEFIVLLFSQDMV